MPVIALGLRYLRRHWFVTYLGSRCPFAATRLRRSSSSPLLTWIARSVRILRDVGAVDLRRVVRNLAAK
jgi:hypothetical protein